MAGSSSKPRWTRDEVILAIDLYMRGGRRQLAADDPGVVQLRQSLRSLPIHEERREDAFRSPTAVGMKLGDFLALDLDADAPGFASPSRLDKAVWDEFADEPQRLHRVADAIRSNFTDQNHAPEDPDDEEFEEGMLLTRLHKQRERDPRAARRKKQSVLADTGRLACEVCGFDFAETYGSLGDGFAECHHTRPLSTLEPGEKTRLSDLAIVCANCHRILHRSGLFDLNELSELVSRSESAAET